MQIKKVLPALCLALVMCSFAATVAAKEGASRADGIEAFVNAAWSWEEHNESTIVRTLQAFIAIPGTSPTFDPDWPRNGHTDATVALLASAITGLKEQWGKQGHRTEDITIAVLGGKDAPEINANQQRRTPLIYIDVPAYGPQKNKIPCYFTAIWTNSPKCCPGLRALPRVCPCCVGTGCMAGAQRTTAMPFFQPLPRLWLCALKTSRTPGA